MAITLTEKAAKKIQAQLAKNGSGIGLRLGIKKVGCNDAFSGHKLCGPTGIGILYGKAALLERMQPFKGGGDMILSVTFEKTTYNTIPHKFEAGTPPIAAAIGLGAAVDYLLAIGMDAVGEHELDLLNYATEQMVRMPGVRIIGTAEHKAAVLSFTVDGVHPHDIGTLLNQEGIRQEASGYVGAHGMTFIYP